MSWQNPPPELDPERAWREAITYAVLEIVDRLGAIQHHSNRVQSSWRRLALSKDWLQDTGGER